MQATTDAFSCLHDQERKLGNYSFPDIISARYARYSDTYEHCCHYPATTTTTTTTCFLTDDDYCFRLLPHDPLRERPQPRQLASSP